MGYAARASNGESPRELTDRKFKHVAVQTIDRHAGVIGQVVEALNITNEQARVSREFVADLSVRLEDVDKRLSVCHAADLQDITGLIDWRDKSTFLGRLRWLLTGK